MKMLLIIRNNFSLSLIFNFILIFTVLVLTTSCASLKELEFQEPQLQEFDNQIFGLASENRIDASSLISLSEEIRNFLDEHINPTWRPVNKLTALRNLFATHGEYNIHYDSRTTRSAIDTFISLEGNCLSFAALFVASARYVGLDSNFQIVDVDPMWETQGMTIIRYEHVVAFGELSPGETYVVDLMPFFVIDGKETRRISDDQAFAHYLNNLGAEQLLAGNDTKARSLLAHSLVIDKNFSDAWNNMGIAMNRAGNHDLAEYCFTKSISLNRKNLSALRNLSRLYTQSYDSQGSRSFIKEVELYQKKDAYFLFNLAKLNLSNGDSEEAKLLIRVAISLKKNEPRFYKQMAEIYQREHQPDMQKKYLRLAQKYRDHNAGNSAYFNRLGPVYRSEKATHIKPKEEQ